MTWGSLVPGIIPSKWDSVDETHFNTSMHIYTYTPLTSLFIITKAASCKFLSLVRWYICWDDGHPCVELRKTLTAVVDNPRLVGPYWWHQQWCAADPVPPPPHCANPHGWGQWGSTAPAGLPAKETNLVKGDWLLMCMSIITHYYYLIQTLFIHPCPLLHEQPDVLCLGGVGVHLSSPVGA